MTTAVELQRGLQPDSSLDIITRLSFRQGFLGSVQTGDISLVMLGVVEGHDFARNGRFEGLSGDKLSKGMGKRS